VRGFGPIVASAWLLALAPTTSAQEAEAPLDRPYDLLFEVRLVPSERVARVRVRVGAGAEHLRSVRWRVDPERHFDFEGDGQVVRETGYVRWEPPRTGGSFRYTFRIDHLRDEASYDARCAESWALFRGDDLVPPAIVRAVVGARSRARLRLRLPERWSAVAPYERLADRSFSIDHPDRRFDRPTGWLLMGRLGVLREKIAGSHVAVAGPIGQGLRRHDILALLRWTLPDLRKVVGELPPRLLVVGADDPMWRGGLSARGSLFLHGDRPLISPDLSSPVLHEVLHVVLGPAGPGGDWVAEGLSELYSLELLRRSGTVSRRRHAKALDRIARRAQGSPALEVESATGDAAARAVTVLRALDREIRSATGDRAGLDTVVARLAASREPLTTARLQSEAEVVAGRELGAFFRGRVPNRLGGSAPTSPED
jgi:hypothetical protein